jgi:hypothetical protein
MLFEKFGLKLNLHYDKNSIDEIYLFNFKKEIYFRCVLPYDTFFKVNKISYPIPKGVNIFYISEDIFFKILGNFKYIGPSDLKNFLKQNELEELII